ncbi:MAG: hypothetical protein A2X23_06165 [Chloroflexi bacterium GWC2_73_18]|nr:MAG: hypothetical protein A2X23_06165 [Chloroflexi bacterium GWC2_73_18]
MNRDLAPFLVDPDAPLGEAYEAAARRAIAERWAARIWERDASLWSPDPGVQATCAARLGWLLAPETFLDRIEVLEAFAATARAGFRGAVLAGMGGSSLAPHLWAAVFGTAGGGIPVTVLDSTDPAAVLAVDGANPPEDTLYLVATKSGTTSETLAFLGYFWRVAAMDIGARHEGVLERLREVATPGPERWLAEHFVAITDPGRSVEAIPHADAFREVFLNPPDVGGRYSALTYMGLVPAALLGVDLHGLLGSAVALAERCHAAEPGRNPGLALGLALGTLARAGRDKLTLLIDPRIDALGAWIEQLVAESTGKAGTGIVPIDGEPPGPPEAYGPDRVFVRIGLADDLAWMHRTDALLAELAVAGHPVIGLTMDDLGGLGGEFFRWEFATAVAGAVLGVNPFDEPDVDGAKRMTEAVLARLPEPDTAGRVDVFAETPNAIIAQAPPLRLVGDAPLRLAAGPGTVPGELRRHLDRVPENGYLAIGAFIAASEARDAALRRIRLALRDATRRPVVVGYGPRYLHSTGQLFKGGTPSGCFLQLLADGREPLEIPGRPYGFETLIDAQAEGDFQALEAHERPILRIHLGADPDAGLAALESALAEALARG